MKTIKTGVEKFFTCPEGYIFKDENSNVINATKIVLEKKKKEYPKTYEECEKILGLEYSIIAGCLGYEYKLLNAFQKLLMCRDAYWKIAGEEMGLGNLGSLIATVDILYLQLYIGVVLFRKSKFNIEMLFFLSQPQKCEMLSMRILSLKLKVVRSYCNDKANNQMDKRRVCRPSKGMRTLYK